MTVTIVGSGPAGLTLAYILKGNIPFYDPDRYGPHPDAQLHKMLLECPNLLEAASNELILNYVRVKVHSFFSTDCSPQSLLMDTLRIPSEANLQSLETMEPRIIWKHFPDRCIPCRLFGGSDGAGGQWIDMSADSEDSRVLSYAEMLSLPGYSFSEFYAAETGDLPPEFFRPPRKIVAKYYQHYALKMQLDVEPNEIGDIARLDGGQFALYNTSGNLIHKSTDIVIASGISRARTQSLETKQLASSGAVVVVGSGVSAADAVIEAKPNQVLHIYKWVSPAGEPTPLRKYPKKLYPEYAAVFQEMKSRKGPTYVGIPNGQLIQVDGGKIQIRKEDGDVLEVQAKKLVIRTGRAGSLAYARHILPTAAASGLVGKRSLQELGLPLPSVGPHLWVVGSLTGDSLVRYISGMCCAAAGQIMRGS